MSAEHNKGPWYTEPHLNGSDVYVSNDEFQIAICLAHPKQGEAQANANLIAAAPDLLEALEKEAEWRAREADGAIDHELDYETMVGQYRRAAIAKARGEA